MQFFSAEDWQAKTLARSEYKNAACPGTVLELVVALGPMTQRKQHVEAADSPIDQPEARHFGNLVTAEGDCIENGSQNHPRFCERRMDAKSNDRGFEDKKDLAIEQGSREK
jgi:hypothetical protein